MGISENITSLLKDKSILKQEVYNTTRQCYKTFRTTIEKSIEDLKVNIKDERVRLKYDYNGEFETHAFVGSDVLVFTMHTNVFTFPENNPIWKNSYFEENNEQGYFGIINIYNFLADSFLHNRMNDLGYLIGRVFINKEMHFIMEGKGDFAFQFKNIRTNKLTQEAMQTIFETSVKHAASFDLHTPPYQKVSNVNVHHIKTTSNAHELRTGKRLGFRFEAETLKNN